MARANGLQFVVVSKLLSIREQTKTLIVANRDYTKRKSLSNITVLLPV